jgi:hypothetical protein
VQLSQQDNSNDKPWETGQYLMDQWLQEQQKQLYPNLSRMAVDVLPIHQSYVR